MFGGKITRVPNNICTTMENKREEAWIHEETVLLIELWGDQRVHEQLENTPKRNLEIFKRICQDIKDRLPDFSRSAQDCRARIKRLKTKYFQTRRDNNKTGGKQKTFPYILRRLSISFLNRLIRHLCCIFLRFRRTNLSFSNFILREFAHFITCDICIKKKISNCTHNSNYSIISLMFTKRV